MITVIGGNLSVVNSIANNQNATNSSSVNNDNLFAQILALTNLTTQKVAVTTQPELQNVSPQQQVRVAAKAATPAPLIPVKKPKPSDPSAVFVADGQQVVVTVKKSYSDNINKIYWSTDNFKTRHYISTDNQLGNYNIGTFKAGTSIAFGIDNGQGSFFRTGVAGFNPDGIAHALVTKTKTVSSISFEDKNGGGDFDYNDVILSVMNKPTSGTGGAGGYPELNPQTPVGIGGGKGGIIQDDNETKMINWLSNLGLQGNDISTVITWLSKSKSINLDDLLNKVKELQNANNQNPLGILELLNANTSQQAQNNNLNKPESLSQLNLTIKKITNLDSSHYNPVNYNNEYAVNTNFSGSSSTNNKISDFSNFISLVNSDSSKTAQSNTTIPTATTGDVKLLNAIYNFM